MKLSRTSPAYGSHVNNDAEFGSKSGWLRVDYFKTNTLLGDRQREPLGPTEAIWSAAIEAEHRSVRERAGLFDLTSFGKIRVTGGDATTFLEGLCSNRVSRGPGCLTYTQMLNESGGVISDVTVAQTNEESFLVITGTSALERDLAWLDSQNSPNLDVFISDETSSWACFGVWGPSAREVLAPLVATQLDSESFPYMTYRETFLGNVPIRMSRVTFVGELGWELYIPSEYGRAVWEVLSTAVLHSGGLQCGYRAIDSLRCEKGYLYLGAELGPDRTPAESGVGKFVKNSANFIGRSAVEASADAPERLAALTLDEFWYQLQGGEEVSSNGALAGTITSGGLGFTIGKAVGFAFLSRSFKPGDSLEVRIEGTEHRATIVEQPLYDPTGSRIRA
ncbi:MAG: aminomethyltransferase family protein [Actinobacteria bacterium]|nr:aminomethyltransferase family protein [Actinomycetota bacterium]